MNVPKKEDCRFYHTIDLPGETVIGDWDLRPCIRQYTGLVDFRGASVLDVGTATGFLSFYAEFQGAERVTSFDLVDHFDILPWAENRDRTGEILDENEKAVEAIRNGYHYCHAALKSKATLELGSVYSPVCVGEHDIALMGSLLLHLANPFVALRAIARLCKTIVVTDAINRSVDINSMVFAPNFASSERRPDDLLSWWLIQPGAVARMLGVLGFSVLRVVDLEAFSPKDKTKIDLYSLVATKNI